MEQENATSVSRKFITCLQVAITLSLLLFSAIFICLGFKTLAIALVVFALISFLFFGALKARLARV